MGYGVGGSARRACGECGVSVQRRPGACRELTVGAECEQQARREGAVSTL